MIVEKSLSIFLRILGYNHRTENSEGESDSENSERWVKLSVAKYW